MPMRRSSTSGKRSRVAKRGRPSTTMVLKPSTLARVTMGMATWLAPTTRRMEAGTKTSAKTRVPSTVRVAVLPALIATAAALRAAASRAASPSDPSCLPPSKTIILAPSRAPSSRVRMAPRPPASACAFSRSYRAMVASSGFSRSTGSTKTSMVPPQVRPISQASSSPRSSWSRRGLWAEMTEADSSITWASTQPPMVTEPRTRPPSPTSILAPSFRGVVPRVFTRVARATLPSAFRSRSRCSKSSVVIPLPQSEMSSELAEARQVMGGREMIDERQGGSHAARQRLVGGVAQERVEPEHASRPPLEVQHLLSEHLRLTRVPAIRENQHDGSPIHEVPPALVELAYRLPDPRPARPVAHLGQPTEGPFIRWSAEQLGHTGQARGEGEGLHAPEDVLEGIEELEEEAAVEVHGTRDVAEEHEPHLAPPPGPASELDELALHEIGPHAAAEVDHATLPRGLPAPADPTGQPLGDQHGEPGHFVELLRGEGREILLHEHFAIREPRHFDGFVVGDLAAFPVVESDLGLLLRGGRRGLPAVLVAREGGRHVGHEPVEALTFLGLEAPEVLEAAVEGGQFLHAAHQHGAESEVDLVAVREVDHLESPDRVHHLGRGHRQSRGTQHAAELQHGTREVPRSRHSPSFWWSRTVRCRRRRSPA